MVGLEALYTREIQEMGYKIAIRASFLLGETQERRIYIYKLLKRFYSVRSKLVHGGEVQEEFKIDKSNSLSLGEAILEVQNVLRDSIKKFMGLDTRYSAKQLADTVLDDNVLMGGSLLR